MSGQRLLLSLWLRLCRWLWKYPLPFLFSTLLINVAINIASTWLITPTTTKAIPDTSLVGNIIGWVSAHWVLSLFFGMISIALLLVTWPGSRESESTYTMPRQVQMSVRDRERMLQRLRLRYKQSFAQSLQGAVQIELGLASRPAAIQNAVSLSLRLPEQPEQALPAHTSILDAYNQAQQELLILGEPGAGKSTLLLELAQHLVEQAEQDTQHPLPVLIPLSSWAATKKRPLQEWVVEQMTTLYAMPENESRHWLHRKQILLLLDGLDEMEASARAACIEAINIYYSQGDGVLQPLVVCSRTNEYEAATTKQKLMLHMAVVVQPLSIWQVDAYLASLGKSFAALRSTIQKTPALQEIVTTPLMVQVLLLAYHGTSGPQPSQTKERLHKQIWDDYLQRMIRHKGNATRYPFQVTCAWLSLMARQMRATNETIFFSEQIQRNWLPPRQRVFYTGSMALLSCGLCGWLGLQIPRLYLLLVGEPTSGQLVGFFGGLLWVLLFVLIFMPRDGFVGPLVKSNVLIALLCGSFFNLLRAQGHAPAFGLLCGLQGVLLYTPFLHIELRESKMFRSWLIVQSCSFLISVLPVVLVLGLIGWLIGGLPWLIGWFGRELSLGLLFGGLSILLLGLFRWLLSAIHSCLLRLWLSLLRIFPLNVTAFLDDATARIFLQRVGKGHSFIHRLLLDYFADLPTTPPAPSSDPHYKQPPPSTP